MKRLEWIVVSGLMMIVLVACTLQEVGQVATDAVNDAPAALTEILANPTPSNVGIVAAAFIVGLLGKSAARGFGKGATATSRGIASVCSSILGFFKRK
jgi:hypothetical protein